MLALSRKMFATKASYGAFPRFFATARASGSSNPYYILGVEKTESFDEIKRKYYELAAEYHPDKNNSPDAPKRFMVIKEAFETIQKWHGKDVKMDLDRRGENRARDFESMRPNSEHYKEDFWEERERDHDDYKEFAHKAGMDPETAKFKDSFETIYDIKDIKFRPDDIVIPDASKRFNLDERTKIKNFSDRSGFFLVFVIGMFVGFFYILYKTILAALANCILFNA